jgi:RNA polymerase sigma-70 factor (ECF subfamily)
MGTEVEETRSPCYTCGPSNIYFASKDQLSLFGAILGSTHLCDEEQLLSGALRFDTGALAQIHDCFYTLIYRYVRYRTDDEQIAEDAASEVFMRLLDAIQNNKAPRNSLRGWLFGTASHIVNDHFRRKYRIRGEDLSEHSDIPAGADSDPEYQLQLHLNHEQLRSALVNLTPEQQHVVTLRFGQGLPHREVAEILDKSEGAVKLLQIRALRALRRALEPTAG